MARVVLLPVRSVSGSRASALSESAATGWINIVWVLAPSGWYLPRPLYPAPTSRHIPSPLFADPLIGQLLYFATQANMPLRPRVGRFDRLAWPAGAPRLARRAYISTPRVDPLPSCAQTSSRRLTSGHGSRNSECPIARQVAYPPFRRPHTLQYVPPHSSSPLFFMAFFAGTHNS